jgi:RNA polymerase sigma-70 factor (ECF subfamily)
MDGNNWDADQNALVRRSRVGDARAFGDLYALHYDKVFRLCLRRLNDRHEAEDAA